MAKLLITYTKSTIGYAKNQKQTVRSLGLKKLHQAVVLPDNAAVRGMIFTVKHLVGVEEVADDYSLPIRTPHVRPTVVNGPREQPSYQAVTQHEAQAPLTASFAPVVLAAAEEPTVLDADEEPTALDVAEPDEAAVVADASRDDLALLEGIGPKIAEALQAQGVTSFAQLAAMDAESIKALLDQPGLRLADPETWPEQARLLAEGRQDEFDALVERLKGGKSV